MYKVECTVREIINPNHELETTEIFKCESRYTAYMTFVDWGDDCLENGYEAELVMFNDGTIEYLYTFSEGKREVVTSPLD